MIKVRGLSFALSSSIIALECLLFGVFPLPFDLFFHKDDTPVTKTISDKPVFVMYGLLPATSLMVNCTAKLYSMRILYKMKSQLPQVFTITRSGGNLIKEILSQKSLN